MLIPFPPGTGNDVVGRVVGRHVSDTPDNPSSSTTGPVHSATSRWKRRGVPPPTDYRGDGEYEFSVNRWTMLKRHLLARRFHADCDGGDTTYSLMVSKSVASKTSTSWSIY